MSIDKTFEANTIERIIDQRATLATDGRMRFDPCRLFKQNTDELCTTSIVGRSANLATCHSKVIESRSEVFVMDAESY
ncbi:hypothetical protein [Paraburkholderia humisilvae]|uniref:hypothetical protein n=1 Tax=Paraburkholderia humisilvae TaxID=627669 RepID=UPI001C2E127C|nr:hypothetical protein [Paraburkholderia humisilvae]